MSAQESPLPDGAAEVLSRVGITPPFTAERLAGGMNNQVFRVRGREAKDIVLKAYFHDPDDSRDRLGAEFAFLEFATRLGLRCVPRPLAQDPARHLGVYSFVEGRRPDASDVTADAMAQALAFLNHLNRPTAPADDRANISLASESCLSANQHLATVERRLARLRASLGSDAIERDAAGFLATDVDPLWNAICGGVLANLTDCGTDPLAILAQGNRVLSPSDFGFHNALRAQDGTFSFLDFEYAGWDDPAKLVGDAFNQVKVPLPERFYPQFRDAVAAWSPHPEQECRRYDILRPVYAIKWIAIMLNEFLPTGDRRRAFAASQSADRRPGQLAAARAKFEALAAGHPAA